MLFRSACVLIVVNGACAALAQAPPGASSRPSAQPGPTSKDVSIHFTSETPKKIWVSDQLPSAEPEKSIVTKATDAVVPFHDSQPNDQVFVLELTTGNLAAKPLKSLGQTWNIQPEDYKYIFKVHARVEHEGQPVATAHLTLTSGNRTQSQIIAPKDLGMTTFYAVNRGPVKLEVEYKIGDKTKKLPAQTVDLSGTRSAIEPNVVAVIDEDVPIAESPFPRKMRFTLGPNQRPAAPERSPVGTFVVIAASVVLGLGLLYWLLKFVQKNPQKVSSQLGKLGVQLPDPNAASDGNVAPATSPTKPEPVQQIILDDAGVSAVPTAVAATSTPVALQPKLVGTDGTVIQLIEGTTSVGRDAGAGICLASESTVSRHHAEIVRTGDSILLRDLGSTNGSFVNGIQVQGEAPIRAGDTVQFGAVRFRYEV